MSRVIYGITVGTPIRPQSVIDKSTHAKDTNIHVSAEEKKLWNDGITNILKQVETINTNIGNVEILLSGL